MPVPISKMIQNMHALRDEVEDVVVGQAAVDLAKIFDDGAKNLAFQESKFTGLLTHPNGQIQNIPENIETAQDLFQATLADVDEFLVGPGELWADDIIPKMHKAGRDLARANLNVHMVNPEKVKAAFDLVSDAEKAVLVTGYNDSYKIMNVVGNDVAEWFRETMVEATIEELPIVNKLDPKADTLMSRLVQSGRIKPMTIKTQSGKIITRSVRQRAEAIARIESAKVINRTHETLVDDVLGEGAVYRNSNPRDSRTTPVCSRASQQAPMSLAEWSESSFGRPPRLNPFHLCRSVLIGGRPEWFEDLPEGKAGPLPKVIPGKAPKKKKAVIDREARAAAKAKAAQEALKKQQFDTEVAKAQAAIETATTPAEIGTALAATEAAAAGVEGTGAIVQGLYAAAKQKTDLFKGKALKKQIREKSDDPDFWQKPPEEVKALTAELKDLIPEEEWSELNLILGGKWQQSKQVAKDDFWEKFHAAPSADVKESLSNALKSQHASFFSAAELVNIEESIALAVQQQAATAYSAGLAEILTGKLGPKKIKTVQKKTKEHGLEAGIPEDEIDNALDETLKAMEAAFTDEEKAFAIAYDALVTTKSVPLGDAAEILAKAKAGQLHGKSAAKAKQALEEIKAVPAQTVQAAPTDPSAAFAALDDAWNAKGPEDFAFNRDARGMGGIHAKEIWTDADGSEWLFKPADAGFVVRAEEAVYKVQRLLDPDTPEVRFIELNGREGSIQRIIPDVTGELVEANLNSAFIRGQIQREHVLDWLVSNHDPHIGQFIFDKNDHLFGIDKGQSFKWLGQDKLDLDFWPNEHQPIYNILGRRARDNRGADFDLDPEITFKHIKTIEALDDDVYREWLRPYAAGRPDVDTEAFLDMAIERKHNLRADFEGWYRDVLRDPRFKFGEAAAEVVDDVLPAAAPADVRAIIAEVESHAWQGKAIGYDGPDIEDQQLVLFTDKVGGPVRGEVRTNAKMKVSAGANPKMMDWLSQQQVRNQGPERAGPAQIGDPMLEDVFWEKVLGAVKTTNHHVGDGDYNQSKIDAAMALRPTLHDLADSSNPDLSAMSNKYLEFLDDIEEAMRTRSELPQVGRYLKQFPDPEVPAVAAAPEFEVVRTDLQVWQRSPNKGGVLTATGNRATPREAANIGVSGEQYTVKFSDGMEIDYRPSSDNNPQAVWGQLDAVMPGSPSEEFLELLGDRLKMMGIDGRVSTPDDLELMYLKRQGHHVGLLRDEEYGRLINEINDRPAAEQVAELRQYWNRKLGVDDVTQLENYNPAGEYEKSLTAWTAGEEAVDAGTRAHFRFDVGDEDIPKGYNLYHSPTNLYEASSDREIIEDFFERTGMLEKNAHLVTTSDKIRTGVRGRQASAADDMFGGGAAYSYLRSLSNDSTWRGLYFKRRNFRRLDARHHNYDAYGKIREEDRRTSLDDLASWSSGTSNEILFKHGLSFLSELEAVVLDRQESVDRVIEIFRAAKIERMPDGRALEDVVITKDKWRQVRE